MHLKKYLNSPLVKTLQEMVTKNDTGTIVEIFKDSDLQLLSEQLLHDKYFLSTYYVLAARNGESSEQVRQKPCSHGTDRALIIAVSVLKQKFKV